MADVARGHARPAGDVKVVTTTTGQQVVGPSGSIVSSAAEMGTGCGCTLAVACSPASGWSRPSRCGSCIPCSPVPSGRPNPDRTQEGYALGWQVHQYRGRPLL